MPKPERTRKPCPGCGVDHLRETLLCIRCKQDLERGRQAEQLAKKKAAELGNAGFIAIQVPAPESMPAADLIPVGIPYDLDEARELAAAAAEMMLAILPELDVIPTKPSQFYGDRGFRDLAQAPAIPVRSFGSKGIRYRLGTEEQRRAIANFWDKLAPLVRAVHQHGIDHGRDLLRQLAAGEITVDALNSATTRAR